MLTDGGDDKEAPASKVTDDLFADLQEELDGHDEELEQEDDEEAPENRNLQEEEEEEGEDGGEKEAEQLLEDSFGEEVDSIDDVISDLSSSSRGRSQLTAGALNGTTTTTTTAVDDIFFGLDDEEREAKEWATFCSSPAVSSNFSHVVTGLHFGGRTQGVELGLLPIEQLDETVMDGLLTPAGFSRKDDDLARRLTAVTPSLHPAGGGSTSPTRPRKKLSFSSLADSILAGDEFDD
jgi:hypothetical protein